MASHLKFKTFFRPNVSCFVSVTDRSGPLVHSHWCTEGQIAVNILSVITWKIFCQPDPILFAYWMNSVVTYRQAWRIARTVHTVKAFFPYKLVKGALQQFYMSKSVKPVSQVGCVEFERCGQLPGSECCWVALREAQDPVLMELEQRF